MATGTVTVRAVEGMEPHPEKDVYLWDAKLSGFGVKVTSAGKRVYLVQYRIGGRAGKTKRVTIGEHGRWSTPDARKEATRILGDVAHSVDVAGQRSEARKELTLNELCDLYFIEAPNIVLARKGRPKKTSTLAIDKSNIDRHVRPLLGSRKLGSIRRQDIDRMQGDIAKGKTAADERTKARGRALVTGGRGTAARAVAVLGAIFSFAMDRELCKENPVRGVRRFATEERKRFLSDAEIDRLADVLDKAEEAGMNPNATTAVRLLMLTGCRKSEILTLRWSYIDWERKLLRLPDSKTGAKVVQVVNAVLELLRSLPRRTDTDYALSGDGGGHYIGLQKAWETLRVEAGLDDVRLHDLRHTFASVAAASNHSLPIIACMLGHTQTRTTQRYAHLADDPVRAAVDTVGGYIANRLLKNRFSSAEGMQDVP